MASTFKALIFDYGGVLEGPLNISGFQNDLKALAVQHGFREGKELWNHLYVSSAWEQAKRGEISRDAFWKVRLLELGLHDKEDRDVFIHRLYQHRGIRPEMRTLLTELHSVCRLAVLSNTARRDFSRYLAENCGFNDLFDIVVSSAEVGMAKPEPEIYLLALERLELLPGDALFIDDLSRNTEAAEELGMKSIVFVSPTQLRAKLMAYNILR